MAFSPNLNFPKIEGYRLTEQLYQSQQTAVYRGILEAQQRTVVIKLLRSDCPTSRDLVKFRNQYLITCNLPMAGVVKPVELRPWRNAYALVMEDFGGIALEEYVGAQRLRWQDVLAIALQIADILHDLHQARIIHKDIKPANLLIHPESKQIQLIDFSLASLLPKENQELQSPNVLEGSLAYMAPEQTGRMNRGIDYRADFYSVGVMLYELLSGQLPFLETEPLALMHCHIAKTPIAVHEVNAQVPVMLSAIVAKLMAKNVEERYQSARGLKHDLLECGRQWEITENLEQFELEQFELEQFGLEKFELGERDISDRFLIPEKLYGREAEVQTLLEAFGRVSQGLSEMVLVAGFAGIGKTSVINEVHKPITQTKGYFIKGKFGQYNRQIPFSAVVGALQSLIGQLLGESDDNLAAWRTKILTAVGDQGQVLIDVIPELVLVIGPQPAAIDLSGNAAKNRFNLLFSQFIRVFTAAEHPLVIFLDDLQWVDSASLHLLKFLIEGDSGYLLVLGAYRNNEISVDHPLMLTLEDIRHTSARFHTLTLKPLRKRDLARLVADSLRCSVDVATPLAQLVYQKTQGNPFFAIQLLQSLQADGWITFNANAGYWQGDLSQIGSVTLTGDVVEFMVRRLKQWPQANQNALSLAACLGNQFDLDTLAVVCEQSLKAVAHALWPALQAGLIMPESETYKFFQGQDDHLVVPNDVPDDVTVTYRFLHDRVQQAAYRLIPDDQIQQVHLDIGRRWLHKTPVEEQTTLIFDIVGQLNLGHPLITDTAEQQTLIQLNLQAAKQTLANTAYSAADNCLQICRKLLSAQSWDLDYALSLDIYNTSVEIAYLQGHWQEMEDLALVIEQQAKRALDVALAYELKIEARTVKGQFLEAIDLGLQLLSELGIEFPEQPNDDDFKAYLEETQRLISGRSIAEILSLPQSTSTRCKKLLRLLVKIGIPAYSLNPNLYLLIGLKMVQLSLRYGNTAEATLGYLRYGILNCNVLGDIETGYRFGQASLELSRKFRTTSDDAYILWVLHTLILHWKEPIKQTLAPLQEAYALGLKTGDLAFAGYSAYSYCAHAYLSGYELSALATEVDRYTQAIAAINQDVALSYTRTLQQSIQTLLSPKFDLDREVQAFDEILELSQLQQKQDKLGLLSFYVNKLILLYLFSAYDEALQCYRQAGQFTGNGIGTVGISQCLWVGALTCLSLLIEASGCDSHPLPVERSQLEQWIADGKAQLSQWAIHNSHYYQHKYILLCAESYRLEGNQFAALEAYDQAISGAKAGGYSQDEALANELAAKFYLAWGKEKIAAAYMKEAYFCYERWGARAKMDDLEARYASLLQPILNLTNALDPLVTLDSIVPLPLSDYAFHASYSSGTLNQAFDLATLLKSVQAISESINLSELLQKLAPMMLQTSGAERLVLLLPSADNCLQGNCLQVRVTATPDTTLLLSEPLAGSDYLPEKLLHYVHRTQKVLVVDGADSSFLPVVDPYLQQHGPRSILCLPLMNQTKLVGLLYLDHLSVAGVFSRERITILNFLGSQAAISLENVLLNQALAQQLEVQTAKRLASENRFQKIVENISGVVFQTHVGTDGTASCSYISPNCHGLYEVSTDAIMKGQYSLRDFEHREDRSTIDQVLAKARQSLQPFEHEFRIITPSGILKWVHVSSCPSSQPDGSTLWDGSIVDVSDRKRAERALQLSESLANATFDQAAVGFAESDLTNGKIIRTNDLFCRMTGYTTEELESLTVADLTFPEDISDSLEKITQLRTGLIDSFTVEKRYICKDQSWFWANTTVSLTQSLEENSPRCLAVVQDISDRKAAELALQESQERFQRISDNIPGMIYRYVLHPDGSDEMPYVNSQVRELYELEPDALLRDVASLWERIHPEDIVWLQNAVQSSAETLHPFQAEYRVILPKKGLRWLQMFSQPKRLDNGDVIWDGVAIDITERKEAEVALRDAQVQFRRMTENVPGMIYRYVLYADGSEGYTYVSSQVRELYECEPETALNDFDHFKQRIHPDDLPRLQEAAQVSAKTLQPYRVECRLTLPRKGLRWMQLISLPERLDNGDVVWDGIVIDITDRKQAEAQQQRQLAILESASDFIGTCDPNGQILYLNRTWRQLLQKDEDKSANRIEITDQHPRWALDIIQNEALPIASERGIWIGETAILGSNNQEIPTSQVVIAHKSSSGEIDYFSTIIRDISGQKAVEKELITKQNHLEALLNNIPHIAWIKDANSRFIAVNKPLAKVFGTSPNEMVGKTDFDFSPETIAQNYQDDDRTVLTSGRRKVVEEKFRRSDGSWGWLETIKTPFRNSQGELAGTVGIAMDISDRKRYEQELLESKAFLQTVLDTVPLSVFWKDSDSCYIGSNQNFATDAGFDRAEEIAGLTDFDMPWAETEAEGYRLDDQVVMKSGLPKLGIIETQVQSDGTQVWVETNKLPLHDLVGNVIGVMGTYQDISERKRAEAELQHTNEELVRATRLKDEFLANMSHELRTPLNSVIGFSQLLQQDHALSDRHKEDLNTINRSGAHLLSLINDILEMSKIEAGRTTLNLATVNLPQLLNELRDMLKLEADTKRLVFDFSYAADIPHYIEADEIKLRQILLNLLSNALKFTERGQVTFFAELRQPQLAETDGKTHLRFSVTDTGPGISAENQIKIFQPFVQASEGRHSPGGTGLGLSISQKFARMMGGNISVSSAYGQGSTFHCDIWVDLLALGQITEEICPKDYGQVQGFKGLKSSYRLLIADDNLDNCSLLQKTLSISGFEVEIAQNGKEAVDWNERWQPDLIWMDIRMPVMDGLEAVRQIRQASQQQYSQQQSGHQPKIIAITANAFARERETALEAGCDDFISKPFAVNDVLERLERWLEITFIVEQESDTDADGWSASSSQHESRLDQPSETRSTEELMQVGYKSMPEEWQVAFHHAVCSLNDKAVTALLDEVPEVQQDMVNLVKELQSNYRYDTLFELLQRINATS